MQTEPMICSIDDMVVGANTTALYQNIVFLEPTQYSKCTACEPLAKCAIANICADRLSFDSITDRPANTSAFMKF